MSIEEDIIKSLARLKEQVEKENAIGCQPPTLTFSYDTYSQLEKLWKRYCAGEELSRIEKCLCRELQAHFEETKAYQEREAKYNEEIKEKKI